MSKIWEQLYEIGAFGSASEYDSFEHFYQHQQDKVETILDKLTAEEQDLLETWYALSSREPYTDEEMAYLKGE